MSDTAADLPARRAKRVWLSLEGALDLVVCGVLLAGLSVVAQYLDPDFQRTTLLTGLVGGGLCALWGVLGRRGTRCRAVAIGTLAAVVCVLVRQAVQTWEGSGEGASNKGMVVALMAVLAACCVVMLANLAREGKGAQA